MYMYPFAEPERQQLKRHFNLFVLYLQSIGRVWGNVGEQEGIGINCLIICHPAVVVVVVSQVFFN